MKFGQMHTYEFGLMHAPGVATVFWDRKIILSVDWLPKKTIIYSDYYINDLEELREVINRERCGKLSGGILLQHDNARPHVSYQTKDAIRRLGFECHPHPPYSPNVAPCDYWLFGKMRILLRGKRFCDFKQLEREINYWVRGTPPNLFATGIDKLPANGNATEC